MRKQHWLLFILIILIASISDIASKNYIEKTYKLYTRTNILGNVLAFTPVYNTGSVFGGFQGNPLLFHILQGLGIVFLFVYLIKTKTNSYIYTIGFSLVFGGALGNFTDKFFRKGVLDFIDMGLGKWRWFVYNLADVFIFIGFLFLILYFFKFEEDRHRKKKDADT